MKIAKIVLSLTILGLITGLSACNTVEGAGRDLQKGSQAVSQSIDEATADKSAKK